MKEIIKIKCENNLLAIIIPDNYSADGINFFTPNSYSQQLAYMHHKSGHKIDAHRHNQVKREVNYTQEVLFIKKGKLRVDFYNDDNKYIQSSILNKGDIILLITGGHGFEVLEEVEMIEVKQGPFIGEQDKTRFPSIPENKIKLIK